MEINIKIEAEGLEGALLTLAKVLENRGFSAGIETPGNVETAPKQEKPKKETTKHEEPKEENKQEDKAPKITLETVRVKLAELNSAGKGADVKALIAEFDSSDKPKLSNVSKGDYAALLEKAADL